MDHPIFNDVVHVFIYEINSGFLAYETGKWRGWLVLGHLTLDHINIKFHSLGLHQLP